MLNLLILVLIPRDLHAVPILPGAELLNLFGLDGGFAEKAAFALGHFEFEALFMRTQRLALALDVSSLGFAQFLICALYARLELDKLVVGGI